VDGAGEGADRSGELRGDPETHRDELPDLSLNHEELETTLDRLVSRLNVAVSAIQKLAGAANDAFEVIRLLIEDETFRRLEPHVAENLRRFSARSAGRERTALTARIDERVAIVQSEIENQQRDQNACLEQLRLYARVRVVVDIAFGDATEPGLQDAELPVLLDFPAPRLRSYPRETVIAEKFQAMVALGLANSRLKDFYHVWVLARAYKFEGDALPRAIKATFARRKTEIPAARPDGLTKAFTEDAGKKDQWAAFTKQVAVDPGSLTEVADTLVAFLMPRAEKARTL
jgi:hypothetical protein